LKHLSLAITHLLINKNCDTYKLSSQSKIVARCLSCHILLLMVFINTEADSLIGIINNILDYSKIESNRMELETIEFDLEDMLDAFYYKYGQTIFLLKKSIIF
jgi:signal transduction histidine kinase